MAEKISIGSAFKQSLKNWLLTKASAPDNSEKAILAAKQYAQATTLPALKNRALFANLGLLVWVLAWQSQFPAPQTASTVIIALLWSLPLLLPIYLLLIKDVATLDTVKLAVTNLAIIKRRHIRSNMLFSAYFIYAGVQLYLSSGHSYMAFICLLLALYSMVTNIGYAHKKLTEQQPIATQSDDLD